VMCFFPSRVPPALAGRGLRAIGAGPRGGRRAGLMRGFRLRFSAKIVACCVSVLPLLGQFSFYGGLYLSGREGDQSQEISGLYKPRQARTSAFDFPAELCCVGYIPQRRASSYDCELVGMHMSVNVQSIG